MRAKMTGPASGSTRLASALCCAAPPRFAARPLPSTGGAAFDPSAHWSRPFCPTRPQSRHSPAHHRQDRQRDRARRGRLPPPLPTPRCRALYRSMATGLEPRQRKVRLGLPQPRQEIAAIPDQGRETPSFIDCLCGEASVTIFPVALPFGAPLPVAPPCIRQRSYRRPLATGRASRALSALGSVVPGANVRAPALSGAWGCPRFRHYPSPSGLVH